MSDGNDKGAPYPSSEAGPIDEWSERIFAALRDWNVASEGVWTRWEPGYVLLTIDRVHGEDVEPITLYTADEELTVCFGYWETQYPDPYDLEDPEPEVVAEHGKALVAQWLAGEIRTAVLTDANGKWCGSIVIEPGEIEPQLRKAADWVSGFKPISIEVRAPRQADWQHYAITETGIEPA